jgi:hypothetical protein
MLLAANVFDNGGLVSFFNLNSIFLGWLLIKTIWVIEWMFQTISSYGGGQSARAISGVPARPVDDLRMVSMGSMDPGSSVKDRSMRTGSGRSEVSLPPDASSTLFVEGLPSDCTRREVSRILWLFSICNDSIAWPFYLQFLFPSLPYVISVPWYLYPSVLCSFTWD